MKKSFFISVALIAFVFVASSFTSKPAESSHSTMYIATTTANGEIASVSPSSNASAYAGDGAWHIKDLSGPTNVRNKPNGKVCMKLKAYTQYAIYANGSSNGWLCVTSIYNMREGRWLRLHGSSTGTYWIAKSILYN